MRRFVRLLRSRRRGDVGLPTFDPYGVRKKSIKAVFSLCVVPIDPIVIASRMMTLESCLNLLELMLLKSGFDFGISRTNNDLVSLALRSRRHGGDWVLADISSPKSGSEGETRVNSSFAH